MAGIVRRKDDIGRRKTNQVTRYAKTTEEEGTRKTENEIQEKTTAERRIGASRNKGQTTVCCRIARRDFA
jgi:hypothetical protein